MEGQQVRQITTGNYEVKAVCGIDEKGKTIYYTSRESRPVNTDIYKIGFDGKKKQCLNDKENGMTLLGTYNATFSTGCKYYISGSSVSDDIHKCIPDACVI